MLAAQGFDGPFLASCPGPGHPILTDPASLHRALAAQYSGGPGRPSLDSDPEDFTHHIE
jgi:hypothetical protein